MKRLFLIVCYSVDLWLLIAIDNAVVFFVEWSGARRVRVERGLILLWGGCFSLWVIFWMHRGWYWLLLFVVGGMWAMWDLPEASGSMRLHRMLTKTVSRLFSTVWLGCLMAIACLPPRQLTYLLVVAAHIFGILFEYSIAMPKSGDPGRRRKAEIARLKELFGSSWIPEPEARPS